jgi:HAE1 family hydrophobic/amphiphilic exporter-1
MTLTEIAIKRPTLIVVIFLALGLLGVFGYFQLRYELLPKVSPPWVVVSIVYPGASPSEVENSVTKPVEDVVASVEKLSNIYGNSYEGLSVISLEFKYSANADQQMQEVQRKVNGALMSLPRDIRTPVIQKFSFDEVPVLKMGVSSDMPSREFYQFLVDEIEPAFAKIDGVGKVSLVGGDVREIRINLDAQKVRAYGLSIAGVTQFMHASNLDFPTGAVKGQETQSIVRISGKFASIDDMRNLVVSRSSEGGDVRLGDVAEIEDGRQDYTTLSRLDGRMSIGINILKQTDANTVEVCHRVSEAAHDLERAYSGQNLRFETVADASLFTIEAANAVKEDLLMAVLLVAAVMFLFLHSVRNSVIVLIAIPASLIASTLAMWALGFSLNLMTLLALSLVIGILVDDSIVVLENIHHHLERGEPRRDAALAGRSEIGFAALSITLVDVVVFVPLTLVVGLVGDIMREFAVVIVVSTLMSLFVSFTLTPMLASRFSKLEKTGGRSLIGWIGTNFERLFQSVVDRALAILKYSLKNRKKVFGGAVVLLFVSFALPVLGLVGSEFIKASDRGEFIVNLEVPPGSTLEHTSRIAQQVERIIGAMPETRKVMSNVGLGAQNIKTSNVASIYVALSDRSLRKRSTDQVTDDIKRQARQIPGIRVYIDQIAITGEQAGIGVTVMVRGNNPDSLLAMTERVASAMRKTPTVTDVKFSYEQSNPETRVQVDRQKMAAFGLTVYDVGTTLRVALTGDDESKFREGEKEYPIRIILDKFDRSNPDDVARLSFGNALGRQVELQQFADIYPASGPTKLERFNRTSSIMVTGYVDNSRPLGNVNQDFNRILGSAVVGGTTVESIGDEKSRSDSFGQLGIALLASIIFVYLIMVALYDSFVYPFVVLFSIPLALIGALAALALTGNALSIFSILGIIMMVGLVAKNAILLVDRTNDNRERGIGTEEALVEGVQMRIRPIFMTTLAMVFGMLPIALARGAGSEWKNGLAWALIGGLTSSMFLTLVIVPIVYTWVDRLKTVAPAFFKRPYAVQRLHRLQSLRHPVGQNDVKAGQTSGQPL